VNQVKLAWQSKLVLLLVLPFAATSALLDCIVWFGKPVAWWTVGISILMGLLMWKARAVTAAAAATGAVIVASLMFSTGFFPFEPWHSALVPAAAVAVLAFASTRVGHGAKERLGTAEARQGRSASQIAANLGVAALVAIGPFQSWLLDQPWSQTVSRNGVVLLVLAIAALAEAAADTVSSEIGQVLGGRPRLITNLRRVEPGTDGAVSLAGTMAGVVAAGIVAWLGTLSLQGNRLFFVVSCAGGVFGLLFDSLLGATLERWRLLNNDAVNFLSTASAAAFGLAMLALWR